MQKVAVLESWIQGQIMVILLGNQYIIQTINIWMHRLYEVNKYISVGHHGYLPISESDWVVTIRVTQYPHIAATQDNKHTDAPTKSFVAFALYL